MNLTYEKNGDYLIPQLTRDKESEGEIRKYGKMREKYLKENRSGVYSGMLLRGKLKSHLLQIQDQAEERMELLLSQMQIADGVTEELKAANQMLWVQKMNNIRKAAEEIVLEELIYS
ncbi:TnpV protein [uncultured Robinsoniella sp.]